MVKPENLKPKVRHTPQMRPDTRRPTSELLQTMLDDARSEHVTFEWFASRLHRRSFGMVMLLLGFVAILPGVSILAAMLLLVLGYQMTMARDVLALPGFVATLRMPTQRIAGFIGLLLPTMKIVERVVRPRWQTPFTLTKRAVGFVIVILAVTLFVPIPLSNVIPGAVTTLIAFAYLEEDGVLLSFSLAASLVSFTITTAEVWATFKGANFLLKL